jgi:hypothetical protein
MDVLVLASRPWRNKVARECIGPVRQLALSSNKINASTPYDFADMNLSPCGRLLPVQSFWRFMNALRRNVAWQISPTSSAGCCFLVKTETNATTR